MDKLMVYWSANVKSQNKHRINTLILTCIAVLFTGSVCSYGSQADRTERIEQLVRQMTLEEKIRFIGGTNYMEFQPVERLGVPSIRLANGRSGVRPWKTPNYPYAIADAYRRGTCFPAGICMGASWDADLLYKVGTAIGKECNHKNISVLAGPGVNLARNPYNGRNFESYGEDPFLAGEMAVQFIRGVQSQGVMANVVMFTAMHQEVNRLRKPYQNLIIPERALRELYLPAFKAACQRGEVASFMSAYPRINGAFCSENDWLLNQVLKKEWGFKGFVLSDWGAVHSALPTALGGMDLEMPSAKYMNMKNLKPHLESGTLPESVVDDKVRRILSEMMRFGHFDKSTKREKACETPEHRALALKIAEDGMVLLKNEAGLLPLSKTKIKNIAVIGPGAVIPRLGGGGSSTVAPTHITSPLAGLRREFPDAEIVYAKGFSMNGDITPVPAALFTTPEGQLGLKGEYFSNRNWTGEPAMVRTDSRLAFDWGEEHISDQVRKGNYSIRWTGRLTPEKSAVYLVQKLSSGTFSASLNGQIIAGKGSGKAALSKQVLPENVWTVNELAINQRGVQAVRLEKGKVYDLVATFVPGRTGKAAAVLGWEVYDPNLLETALAAARQADVAVIFAGLSHHYESEGRDPKTIRLPKQQMAIIKAVAAVNPKPIVVLNNGTALIINELLDAVPAVLEAWYPGQEGGAAVARILSGAVNPSGRLPVSFPAKEEDIPALATYPPAKGQADIEYKEGIFMGYRYHETKGIPALFPFGFGLSYTTFEYEDINLSSDTLRPGGELKVSVTVKNAGKRAGAEVVQLYVHDVDASVERPIRELKGFRKVFLKPGERKMVEMTLREKDLQFWDKKNKDWVAEDGNFNVLIGASSSDIRLKDSFTYNNK